MAHNVLLGADPMRRVTAQVQATQILIKIYLSLTNPICVTTVFFYCEASIVDSTHLPIKCEGGLKRHLTMLSIHLCQFCLIQRPQC